VSKQTKLSAISWNDTTSQAFTTQFYITTTTAHPKFRRTWSHVMI